MRTLFLTGFMGAGKSAIGRRVAEALSVPFVDLDAEVERREGMAVPEIFAQRGERAFREAEHQALESLPTGRGAVVATGGGVVLREDNVDLMRRSGSVLYLAVSPEEAMARIGNPDSRPLLAGGGIDAARTILAERHATYIASADAVVDTDGRSEEQVTGEVLALVHLQNAHLVPVAGGSGEDGYDVHVGHGLIEGVGGLARPLVNGDRIALVSDEVVWPLLGASVETSLTGSGFRVSRHLVPPGENSKSWDQAGRLLEAFAEGGLDRDSAVVALGGGVVGDLAGFCAAAYMRGIGVIQVPTTLLGQVDSSIGGKTGVDLHAGKNLAGAFWPPLLVVADTGVLASLPDAEWTNGLVELVKGAYLEGGETLAFVEGNLSELRARTPAAVERAVRAAVAFKAGVVSADLREADLRESLNLGHTLGHALENLVGYGAVPHGLAVAEGMRFAAGLAERIIGSPTSLSERIAGTLEGIGAGLEKCRNHLAPAADRLSPEALLGAMKSDKKSRGGAVRFVLLEAPGVWRALTIEDAVLLAELQRWSRGLRGGQ